MLKDKIEIVICTEKGYLESMSKLFIASLREFGGEFKDISIFSYQPRKEFKISQETIAFFEENNVEYVDLELNKEFCHYPFANKILASAHREKHTSAEILIFLDSDVFFFNEPKTFANFGKADVILRPVDIKNIGAENSDDKNAVYWERLYNLLGVKTRRKVSTTVTNVNIWEYYQGGHIATLTKNNLFRTWHENFIKVMAAEIIPDQGISFIEQSVLAATVSQMELNVKNFAKEYNYPLHMENEIKNSNYIVDDFNSLVSVHYHDIFRSEMANSIIEKINQTAKGRRLNDLINQFNLIQLRGKKSA
jgi:hypothetical protein